MNPGLVVNRATEISSIQARTMTLVMIPDMTQALTPDTTQVLTPDMTQVPTSEATVGIVAEIGDQYGGIN